MPSTSKSASLVPTMGSESSNSHFGNIGIQSVRGVRTLCRCTLKTPHMCHLRFQQFVKFRSFSRCAKLHLSYSS
jgi:hypothetical protein